jgi:uncharacterized repeat protein (TIGR01451 family)
MKLLKTVRLTGALLAGVLLSLFSANAFALTAGGTTISNLATVNYQVGGNAQTAIGSSAAGNTSGAGTATTFVVDNKLNLTVTAVDTLDVTVTPAQTGAVLAFTVTNNGNETQGVSFTTIEEISTTLASTAGAGFTGTDNFDPTGISVFVANGHSGAYVVGTDTASTIPQLAAGASATVYIVATIPSAQVDADVAVEALVAQVTVKGASATYGTAPGANITVDNSAAAWVANPSVGNEQVIFADAASAEGDSSTDALHDGKASSRDVYKVQSAKLTITKGVPTILSDPTGDATPHAIPGAVVKYTVTIGNANSATSNATSIALTDALPANTTWGTSGTGTLAVTTPGVNTGTNFSCPDGSVHTQAATGGAPYATVSCDFGVTTGGTVTVSGLALKPNDTTTITYTVTIN